MSHLGGQRFASSSSSASSSFPLRAGLSAAAAASGLFFAAAPHSGGSGSSSYMSIEEEKRKLMHSSVHMGNDNDASDELYKSRERQDSESTTSSGSIGSGGNTSFNNEKSQPTPAVSTEDPPASRGMVIFSVLFYLVAALVMIMANKWVLNSVSVPLFFLLVQLTIAVLLLHLSAFFGYFTIPTVEFSTCKGLLPLVSINVLGLIFNTYCLTYVDASFYQVARGLVLPFTVFFSYLLLSSKSSPGVLMGVAIVCAGFLMGVLGESGGALRSTSTIGTLLGVFSSLTTSVHAIIVKKSLSVVKGSTMDLVYYNNLLSALLLSPLVFLSGEPAAIMEMVNMGGRPLATFLYGATITGVFGFLICIAGFLSIKVTSPVTHMISSAVRGVIQTFLGMWCFGDVVTAGRGFGIFFILLGSTVYTYIKDREARAREAIASHGRPSPPVLQSHQFQYQEDQARTSAHNSPVLSSKERMSGPTARLGINTSLANMPSSSSSSASAFRESGNLPSPRTPRGGNAGLGLGQPSHLALLGPHTLSPNHLPHQRNVSSPNGLPSRRLSYDGRGEHMSSESQEGSLYNPEPSLLGNSSSSQSIQFATPKAASSKGKPAKQNHGKSLSVSDLKDILISPNNHDRRKEGKEY